MDLSIHHLGVRRGRAAGQGAAATRAGWLQRPPAVLPGAIGWHPAPRHATWVNGVAGAPSKHNYRDVLSGRFTVHLSCPGQARLQRHCRLLADTPPTRGRDPYYDPTFLTPTATGAYRLSSSLGCEPGPLVRSAPVAPIRALSGMPCTAHCECSTVVVGSHQSVGAGSATGGLCSHPKHCL